MKFALVLPAVLTVIVNCAAEKNLDEFIKGNHQFTADLYRKLIKGRADKNFIFSPLTIAIDLGLARLGANGNTADEITKAVGLPKNNEGLLKSLEQVKNQIKSDKFKLSQSVGLYTSKDVNVMDSFKTKLKKYSDAKLESVDFKDITTAIKNINRWVQVQTKHKIKNLLAEDDVDKNTQLVVIDAVHFSAKWVYPLTKTPTKKRFRISRTRSKFVQTMTVTNHFKYYILDHLDAKAIELPYEGKDASMVIVLPNKNLGDISAINRNLAEVIEITAGKCKDKCSMKYVTVEMPIFTVWSRYPMLRDLNELGIRKPFSDDADFGNMVKGSPVKLRNIVQKAFINVTTEGTVAAGAPADPTQHQAQEFRALVNETIFDVNHVSAFFIKIRNVIILAGKLSHYDGFH